MADLTFEVTPVSEMESTARVALSGAIDASTVITFQTELDKLKKEGVRRFLLDMSGIRYVNSTGLGSLVKLADGLENEGGMIALMQIHPKVKVVFDMLGLNAFFKIFKTDEEALSFLQESGAPAEPEPLPEPEPLAPEPEPEPEAPAPAPEPVAEPAPPPPAAEPAPAAAPAVQAAPEEIFAQPLQAACGECGLNLRIAGPGFYRCPRCFALMQVDAGQSVRFSPRPKSLPVQLTLTGEPSVVEGLVSFVRTLAKSEGFEDEAAEGVGRSAGSACRGIVAQAYEGNTRKSFQVLVEVADAEMLLRFADHGKSIDLEIGDFQNLREAATEVSHVPHPRGGNILRILHKA